MAGDLAIIAAVAKGNVIGYRGRMPWRNTYKEDMQHFRRITMGHPIIMGRKTWESLPVRPLEGRKNIVVSTQIKPSCEGQIYYANSVLGAIAIARASDPMPFVIGGGSIYREALPYVSHMYLTRIHKEYEGDTFFPEFDPYMWEEIEYRDMVSLTFITYRNRSHDLENRVREAVGTDLMGVEWSEGWRRVDLFRVGDPRLWWALLQQADHKRNELLLRIMQRGILPESDRQYLWHWADFAEATASRSGQ